jgi:hypothetical protein
MDLERRLRQQLMSEAQQAEVSEDAFLTIRTRLGRRRTPPRMFAVLVASATVLVAAVVIVTQLVGNREAVDDLAATASANPRESTSAAEDRLESEFMLRCFLDSRVRRDFDHAKPCMTARLIDNYSDPVEFIGPSSPNIQRFTIVRDGESSPARKIVDVRAYVGTSTGLSFYSDDQIEIVKEESGWKVDRWNRGTEQPIGEIAEVVVYYPPTEVLCKDFKLSDLTAVTREVAASDNLALSAIQELLSGPTSADSAVGTYFPLGARVESVSLDESGGEVRLTSVAGQGIPCVRAANRAALDRTIRPFVDPAKVKVSPKI